MDNSTLKNLTIDLPYKDREDKNYRIIRKIHENELFLYIEWDMQPKL